MKARNIALYFMYGIKKSHYSNHGFVCVYFESAENTPNMDIKKVLSKNRLRVFSNFGDFGEMHARARAKRGSRKAPKIRDYRQIRDFEFIAHIPREKF